MTLKTLPPTTFGQLHRSLVKDTIDPLALKVGPKSLSTKLVDEVRAQTPQSLTADDERITGEKISDKADVAVAPRGG